MKDLVKTAHNKTKLNANCLNIPVQKVSLFLNITKTFVLLLLALSIFMVSCQVDEEEPQPSIGLLVADAGLDKSAQVGQEVTLDGSGSKDSKGKILSYSWVITLKPAGSNVTISQANQAKPSFTPDIAGDYELELTVFSENGRKTDKVKITALLNTNNNEPTILNKDIFTEMVLEDKFTEPGKADYIVTEKIRVRAKLTVKPGVVIEFEADKGLQVEGQGSLVAVGTATQTITFTGKQKVKGYWRGLSFTGNGCELDHVIVSYGGSSGTSNLAVYSEVTWGSVPLKVTNSTFSNSSRYGVTFGNGADVGVFANNTITANNLSGLYAHTSVIPYLQYTDNLANGNGHNGVAVGGEVPRYTHTQKVIWPALSEGITYLAVDDIIMEADVEVAPGVTMEFMAEKGLYIRNSQFSYGIGYFKAKGTAEKPIIFTGHVKRKGYWKGIMVSSSSRENEFDHVKVSYGGSSNFYNFDAGVKTNVGLYGKVDAASAYASPYLKITNSEFTHSGGYGLYVAGEGSYLEGFAQNKFTDNAGAALYIRANQMHKLDNASSYSGANGFNGIETEGTVNHGTDVAWPTPATGLWVRVVNNLYFKSGVKIVSNARGPLVFMFDSNKALYVQQAGYLIAKGTDQSIVTFTGSMITQRQSNWGGIVFESNSSLNELNKVNVAFGGSSVNSPAPYNERANITVRGAAKVINTNIYNSVGYGLHVTKPASINTDFTTSNSFTNNILGNYLRE